MTLQRKIMNIVLMIAAVITAYAMLGMYFQWPGGHFCLKLGGDLFLVYFIFWLVQKCSTKSDC